MSYARKIARRTKNLQEGWNRIFTRKYSLWVYVENGRPKWAENMTTISEEDKNFISNLKKNGRITISRK